jgi:hypothetical protein
MIHTKPYNNILKVYVLLSFFSTFLFSICSAAEDVEITNTITPEEITPISNTVTAETRFIDKGNGAVLDKNTALMWLKDANVFKMPLTWQAANKAINDMNSGVRPNLGHTDWRIPFLHDMETLIDKSNFYPALSDKHPFENVQNQFYWTSTGLGQQVTRIHLLLQL